MIWVLVALLALGVAAFLLYLFVFRWNRMDRYGSVEVPGDSVVQLPAGRVRVYYEDRFRWRFSDTAEPWSGFSMLVSEEPGGARVDLQEPQAKTTFKARGRNRIPYGELELPHAGGYRVSSQVDADAVDPRITFG